MEHTKAEKKVIVLGGGGCAAMAFIGTLKKLEEDDEIAKVEVFVGTSAGCLIALLLLLGFCVNDIMEDALAHVNLIFEESAWVGGCIRAFSSRSLFGYYHGDALVKYVEKILKRGGLEKDATFEHMFKKTKKEFHVVTTDLVTKSSFVFSPKNTPSAKITTAIKATTAIPFLFPHILYRGRVLVDGGLADNFPLQFVPDRYQDHEVLGLVLTNAAPSSNKTTKNWIDVEETNEIQRAVSSSLKTYVVNVVDAMLVQTSKLLLDKHKGEKTVIEVDRSGLGMLPATSVKKYQRAIRRTYDEAMCSF